MKPFRRLGEATAPDGSVLTLFEHDGAYVLRVNGVELMSTRHHLSEDALGHFACEPVAALPGARVLIGGLGLGFTLQAALRVLAADAHVVVAELLAEVIAWNRDPSYALAHEALADARVEVLHADVADVLRANAGGFDAIMLDVDNGADPLTTSGNAALYRDQGIALAMHALRPSGRLAYWSANNDRAFTRAMRRAGLLVTVTEVRARSGGGTNHAILLGQLR